MRAADQQRAVDPFRTLGGRTSPAVTAVARGVMQHDELRAEVLRLCAWVHPEEMEAALLKRGESFEAYRDGSFFRGMAGEKR